MDWSCSWPTREGRGGRYNVADLLMGLVGLQALDPTRKRGTTGSTVVIAFLDVAHRLLKHRGWSHTPA